MAEQKECPDRGCHDKVEEAHKMASNHEETLYDGETGVKTVLHKIELCLKDKVSKTSVRIAMIASLSILLACFGTLASMWAQTKDVPEIVSIQKESQRQIAESKERIAVNENQTRNLKEDIEELKKGQDKMDVKIDKILERLTSRQGNG